MTNIREIEKAISKLSREQLAEFRSWFQQFDGEKWDEQIENDARSGKLKDIANEALEDYKNGNFREL